MRHNESSNSEPISSEWNGTTIGLPLPIQETELFKHKASPYVLNFLSNHPDIAVSIRQLAKVTPRSERATREAVNVLEANDLVETVREGNARRVRIARPLLQKPDDPVLSIPQTEFQTPIRIAQEYIKDELCNVKGIVLFGSVARGEGDRRSDIDLWVLVDDNHMEQRHRANKLVKHLKSLKIPASIGLPDAQNADFESNWDDIREQLENEEIPLLSPERYSFEIIVETPQSIIGQTERVDAEKLFGRGITLLSSETLERVKLEVLTDD